MTHKVQETLQRWGASEKSVTLFIRHTSASLVIQENADPDVPRDLERWLNRLAPGTWQGIRRWEHRRHRGERELIVSVPADS